MKKVLLYGGIGIGSFCLGYGVAYLIHAPNAEQRAALQRMVEKDRAEQAKTDPTGKGKDKGRPEDRV